MRAIGIDAREVAPAEAETDRSGADFQSGCAIVKGRRSGPEHADAPAGKPPEVNVLHGMREAIRRNGATDEARDFPTPAAVDAGRQHRLAGKALDSAGWGRQDQAKRGTLRRDRGDIGVVLHRNVGDPAEPTQIGLPILAGDLVQPAQAATPYFASYQARGVRLATP
jgi:hypothetical protein